MGRRYTFTGDVVQDEDGRWTAWLVEIPECVTFGDTREDAMRELQDAASVVVQYLESKGEEIPQRSKTQELVVVS